ncbi:hypothetical protein GCM10017776_24020 [Streptomyces griseoluteus]|nr:hypothetical protein GCM10017776_24020 [Streptomyces griseoluteus]
MAGVEVTPPSGSVSPVVTDSEAEGEGFSSACATEAVMSTTGERTAVAAARARERRSFITNLWAAGINVCA